MVLKITNLHILRYLPTCRLYLLGRYTIDNQRCTHTASESERRRKGLKKILEKSRKVELKSIEYQIIKLI